jgi:hypothetical protein
MNKHTCIRIQDKILLTRRFSHDSKLNGPGIKVNLCAFGSEPEKSGAYSLNEELIHCK